MASVRGLQSKYHVLCPICLDVFTDPITTPCGHNYCKSCITHYWDNDWVCQCPLCTKLFPTRPDVFVNTLISEMADQFRKSLQRPAKPDEVSCDVCSETPKLKALKTCLVCLTSFCETHLERHQRVTALKRHKLIDPVKNLEDLMCKRHNDSALELFCKTDHMCVCQICAETDHELHEIVSLEEECEGKRAELREKEAEVQQAIQEKQVTIQEVNCSVEQAEGFIKELKKEISELKKRGSRLKQLSCPENRLHLLQNFPSINSPPPAKERTKVKFSNDVATVRTAVVQLEKTVRQEIEKLRNAELRRSMELWS